MREFLQRQISLEVLQLLLLLWSTNVGRLSGGHTILARALLQKAECCGACTDDLEKFLRGYGPTVGGSQRREPQKNFQQFQKCKLVTKKTFSLRICTMFCMREAVYISSDFRMRAGPLDP